MKTKLIAAAAVAAFAIIGGLFGVILPAQAQSNTTENAASNMSMNTGGDMMRTLHESSANHKWGMISSINNDGEEDWIISGHWMMEMAPQNDTATSNATTTSMISNVTGFNAILHMVMLDGSAMHNHEISNFTQVEDSTFDSETNMTTITGTSTVTMREVPVPNVQTTIELAQDSVIAISLDPDALEDHFGDEPIYGIVVSPEMLEEMKMRYGDKMGMGMMHGPMDSGMMNSSGGF